MSFIPGFHNASLFRPHAPFRAGQRSLRISPAWIYVSETLDIAASPEFAL